MAENVKTGCCGFPCPKTKYAGRFGVVEVQQTFYEPPRIATLQKWREMVPANFEFTLKAWQLITHTAKSPTYRRLKTKLSVQELGECGSFRWNKTVRRAWETTRACAGALAAKLILFQCPASFTPTEQNVSQMRKFFEAIDRGQFRLLWEPRGDWKEELIRSLCHDLNLIHVTDPFLSQPVTKDFLYLRLHGGKGFKQVFTEEELRNLAGLIPPNQPAYVMFNNMAMWDNAGLFQELTRKNWHG